MIQHIRRNVNDFFGFSKNKIVPFLFGQICPPTPRNTHITEKRTATDVRKYTRDAVLFLNIGKSLNKIDSGSF